MIPVILLALFGAAIAYEFSERTRHTVDDYVHAIRDAHDAHQVADAHLNVAAQHHQAADVASQRLAPEAHHPRDLQRAVGTFGHSVKDAIEAGIDHVVAAFSANQTAAAATADAAKHAKAPADRAVVAASAAKVADRSKQIAAALASLGVGQCDVRSYPGVTAQGRDALIARLNAEGMTVTGDNPWNIDTHDHGVQLRAVWDPGAQVLRLIVTASDPLAPCFMIWDKIDPKVKEITTS